MGLALQGALSNVAAGVMILLFRPYRVGDTIESLGKTGRVRTLDLFVTELETLDGLKVVIPNGKLFGDIVVNQSYHRNRRVEAIFRLKFDADTPAVMTRLLDRSRQDPRVLDVPPPVIEIIGMTQDGAEVASRPWTARENHRAVKADQLLCARILAGDAKAELPPLPKTETVAAPAAPAKRKAPAKGRR